MQFKADFMREGQIYDANNDTDFMREGDIWCQ